MEAEGLYAGYGRIGVLDGVSLRVGAGECVGILGHNGTGKTTLLKTLMGLLPAARGSIRLDGEAIERLPAHRRARAGLGYVPQGRRIFPALSVRDNLRFAAAAAGLGEEAAEAVLADFPELLRLLDRLGGALSGGEQQILALARALVARPRLLLLDEPTEGIQPSIVQAMAERIGGLRAARGLSVLLVEQNLDFIRALSDRVLLIHRGRIVRELPAAGMEDPALEHEFIG
ncbi:ABC transporter ATP-binding protein [Craurococcus roseus]|uniref:ABC transporter ATP-binding protein n=2 Tax=Craurococcus roseus TaxID=77585 RepID=A0ABN1FDW4_9PROT